MAYMVILDLHCDRGKECGMAATHEVRNNRNEKIGKFCLRHARDMLAQLEADEEQEIVQRQKQQNAEQFYSGG